MIELTICVALIAFIAFLCVPALLNHTATRVHLEAQIFKSTCWYLQQLARAENKDISLVLHPESNSYDFHNQTHKLAAQVKFGAAQGVCGAPSHSEGTQPAAITFADHTIVFHPQGTQRAGSVYFADQSNREHYAVTVAVAGVPYVRLYHLVKQHWQLCT